MHCVCTMISNRSLTFKDFLLFPDIFVSMLKAFDKTGNDWKFFWTIADKMVMSKVLGVLVPQDPHFSSVVCGTAGDTSFQTKDKNSSINGFNLSAAKRESTKAKDLRAIMKSEVS